MDTLGIIIAVTFALFPVMGLIVALYANNKLNEA